MARVSLSEKEQSIDYIWSWYEDQKEALLDYRTKIFKTLISSSSSVHNKFFGLTTDELNDYFRESEKELEHLICFDLISATEAVLRSDFYKKVFNKDKSDLGRIFRNIDKVNADNISLENDIINNWKKIVEVRKNDFSDFLGLLNYRNWLAHGRYWTPKLGQHYTPSITYNIVENIFNIIDNN